MVFEFVFDDQQFLIELQHLQHGKDKTEVFALRYNDNLDDSDEYEIKICRVEGENLTRLKVMELPQHVLDIMGEELKKAMPQSVFANPYFDELMIFFGITVLTSQDRYVQVSCSQCERKQLYEKKEKDNKTDYIAAIQEKLRNNPNPAWPFKGRLHIQFSVSDKQSRLNDIDLDNLAKTILDSLQGVVFENDAQIDALVATKDFTQGMIANLVAIKELQPGEKPKFQEFLFSGRYKSWREEYKQKEAVGRPTRFVRY